MKEIILTLTAIFICTNVHAEILNINYMNEDNTVYENGTCTIGGDLILPTPPTKRGYTFNGWMPVNVQQIEYLESTGTQWIDTGYYPNQDTGVKTKIQMLGTNSRAIFFGVDASCKYYGWSWDDLLYFGYGQTNVIAARAKINDVIEYNYNKNIYNYSINDIKQNTIRYNYSNFTCNESLWVFDEQSSVHHNTLMRLYYFQIYDNDVLVRDFIPVLDSNNVPCMYDKVEGKFYYNAGTGQFIAGPVIGE